VQPLSLLLAGARWFAAEVAERYRRTLNQAYYTPARLTGSSDVDVAILATHVQPQLRGARESADDGADRHVPPALGGDSRPVDRAEAFAVPRRRAARTGGRGVPGAAGGMGSGAARQPRHHDRRGESGGHSRGRLLFGGQYLSKLVVNVSTTCTASCATCRA
jgi:hypothetical protein